MNIRTIVKVAVLSGIALASVLSFQNYQPKSIKQIDEVKTTAELGVDNMPLPDNSEKLGINKTKSVTQLTIKTTKSAAEISAFYKNVFDENNWKLDSESVLDSTGKQSIKFKKDDMSATVSITKDPVSDFNIVGIESINLNF